MAHPVFMVGPRRNACALVLSAWGLTRSGEFQPLWQSPVLTPGQMESIAGNNLTAEPFIDWAEEHSGLKSFAQSMGSEDEEPPVPYAIIAVSIVDRKTYPGLSLGEGVCLGRRVDAGVVLSYLQPNYPLAPRRSEAGSKPAPQWFEPTQLPKNDTRVLMEFLGLCGWDTASGTVRPLLKTPWAPKNPFSRAPLSTTTEYKAVVKGLAESTKKGADEADPYFVTLAAGTLPFVGPMGARKERAYAERPTGGRIPEIYYPSQVSTKLTVPRPPPSDRESRKARPGEMPADRKFFFRNIFNFAMSVCRQLGCAPHIERRTQASKAFAVDKTGRQSGELTGDNPILTRLAQYGLLPKDPSDPKQLRDALIKLKSVLVSEYRHSIPVPAVHADDEGSFQEGYLSQMAKLNRGRRRSRRVRMQRNPFTPRDVEEAIAYTESRKADTPVPEALSAAFKKLSVESPPEGRELTPDRLEAIFPRRQKAGRSTWTPSARLPSLGQYDLVSRVGPLDPDSEIVKQGRAKVSERPMPYEDPAVMALMLAESEQTLDDAARMWKLQQRTRKANVKGSSRPVDLGMPASSAICSLYRRRRLKAYTPPAGMLNTPDLRTGKVVLLMSPGPVDLAGNPVPGAFAPRVMTFRQGVHLDCDMVGRSPEELPTLLGRAILSTLYWLVEKPSRAQSTDVYVGRVGYPELQLALKAGTTVSLGAVAVNLRKAQAGEPGYRVPLYRSARDAEAGTEADVSRYTEAVRSMLGSDALSSRPLAESKTSTAPPLPPSEALRSSLDAPKFSAEAPQLPEHPDMDDWSFGDTAEELG